MILAPKASSALKDPLVVLVHRANAAPAAMVERLEVSFPTPTPPLSPDATTFTLSLQFPVLLDVRAYACVLVTSLITRLTPHAAPGAPAAPAIPPMPAGTGVINGMVHPHPYHQYRFCALIHSATTVALRSHSAAYQRRRSVAHLGRRSQEHDNLRRPRLLSLQRFAC